MYTHRAQLGFQIGIFALVAGSGVSLGQVDSTDLVDTTVLVDPIVSTAGGAALPEIIAGPFQHGNSAYYLLEPANWDVSEQAAQERLGAHLVTVSDAAENTFIRDGVLSFDGAPRNGWLGLTDADVEGEYVWVNGEPFGFESWRPGEPNGGATQNYAGMLGSTSDWFDLENDWTVEGVVYGVVEVEIPSVLAGPFYSNGHTYYLLDNSNRHQADAAARLLGGHLVTLDDAAETSWVRTNVIEFDGVPRHAWLGLSDVSYEGIYSWDNDSLSSYRAWISAEPNGGTNENYVAMFSNSNVWFDAAYNWGSGAHGVVEVATPNPCTVDMNNDGGLNFLDVSAFLQDFGIGCP